MISQLNQTAKQTLSGILSVTKDKLLLLIVNEYSNILSTVFYRILELEEFVGDRFCRKTVEQFPRSLIALRHLLCISSCNVNS